MNVPISSRRPFGLPLAALCLVLAALGGLAGCAPLVLGGAAATTAVVASDRRTAGEQVEDKAIQMKVSAELARLLEDRGRYNVTSYAGRVLLLGDVPTQADRQRAEEAASRVENVRQVLNQMRVGDITPLSVRSNDSWLTTKVTAALVNTEGVPSRTIDVTTERGVVYLMGKVTPAEAQAAAKVAARVAGVNKVVTAFQLISPESLADSQPGPATGAATTPGTPQATQPPADVEVLPVQ